MNVRSFFALAILLASAGAPAADHQRPDQPEALGQILLHLDFEAFEIDLHHEDALDDLADRLTNDAQLRVRIEGHSDEREDSGIALRRVEAARRYLEDAGIETNRLSTVSFGEDRPVDPGHNEEAWARNRRAAFVIQR